MLELQQHYCDRKRVGYYPKNDKDKNNRTTFVKASIPWRQPKCYHCGKIRHKVVTCPFQRNGPHIIKNSYSIFLRSQVKQIGVPKGTRPLIMVFPKYENKFIAWVFRKR